MARRPPASAPPPEPADPTTGASRRLIGVALFVATFLVSLDVAVISTAMPTVIGQLGGIDLYAWVFSAYLLTSTVSVPIYGKLADLYGRKPVFLVATALFLVGSMLCGQSRSMEQLIVFRLVQGLGAGGVLPITQTILGDVFPLAERARLMGLFSAIWGISGLLGPAIGGVLTERASWRWVFYVNLPLCLLSMALVGAFLRERLARRSHRIDYAGALLLAGAVSALLLGLQAPGRGGAGGPLAAALFVAAGVLGGLFVRQEWRAPEPLVPLPLFGQRLIGVGTLGSFLMGVVLFGQGAFVPPFVQGVMGASPTVAGFVLATTSVGWPAAAAISGRALLRWGYRPPAVVGGALLALGFGWQSVLPPDADLLLPALIQLVIGAGFGAYSTVMILCMQNAVGWRQRGVVTGANQFARSIGGTLGVPVAGAIFAAGVGAASSLGTSSNELLSPAGRQALSAAQVAALQGALAGALHAVYLLLVGAAALGAVVAAFLPGGRPAGAGMPLAAPAGSSPTGRSVGMERENGPAPESPGPRTAGAPADDDLALGEQLDDPGSYQSSHGTTGYGGDDERADPDDAKVKGARRG